MSQRIELGAIVMRDGKLWLTRRAGETWALPGGPLLSEHEDTDGGMEAMLAARGLAVPAIEEDFLETRYVPSRAGQLVYNIYAASEWSGEPVAAQGEEGRWLGLDELAEAPLDPWLRDALLELFGYAEAANDDQQVLAAIGSALPPAATWDKRAGAASVLASLSASEPAIAEERLRARYPELADDIIGAIGDAGTGPELDRKTRSLLVVAMLSALGGRTGPLRSHVAGALNHGAEPAQVIETLRMVAVYAGFPAALEAFAVVEEVFAARGIARDGAVR